MYFVVFGFDPWKIVRDCVQYTLQVDTARCLPFIQGCHRQWCVSMKIAFSRTLQTENTICWKYFQLSLLKTKTKDWETGNVLDLVNNLFSPLYSRGTNYYQFKVLKETLLRESVWNPPFTTFKVGSSSWMNYFAELEGNVEFLAEINQTGQIYKVSSQRVIILIFLLSVNKNNDKSQLDQM